MSMTRYFVTPSNPNIFLIGIYETRLYGFGEKNQKLCLYQKSIFDSGDWEEFYVVDLDVVKSECCNNGLHVASGIQDTTIWIAAREKEFTRVISVDIFTKQFIAYQMLDQIYKGLALLDLNLCCRCLMSRIRYQGYCLNLHCFIITPQLYQEEVGIRRIIFNINKSQHCRLWKNQSFILPTTISPIIAVNKAFEVQSVHEKQEDGKITKFTVSDLRNHVTVMEDADCCYHDVTYCHDNYNAIFCLTRQNNDDNIILHLSFPVFSLVNLSFTNYYYSPFIMDSKFPSFESSPFFLSYHQVPISPSCLTLKPSFIVFQTSNEIVTICLRMLSLSESAYLSLRQIPEPPRSLPSFNDEIKLSVFQRIKKLFVRKKSKKAVEDPWMSLNFIKKTLALSNDFDLISSQYLNFNFGMWNVSENAVPYFGVG